MEFPPQDRVSLVFDEDFSQKKFLSLYAKHQNTYAHNSPFRQTIQKNSSCTYLNKKVYGYKHNNSYTNHIIKS